MALETQFATQGGDHPSTNVSEKHDSSLTLIHESKLNSLPKESSLQRSDLLTFDAAPNSLGLRYGMAAMQGIKNIPEATLNAAHDAIFIHPLASLETATVGAALGFVLRTVLPEGGLVGAIAGTTIGTYFTAQAARPILNAFSKAGDAHTMSELNSAGADIGAASGRFLVNSALAGVGSKLGASTAGELLSTKRLEGFVTAKSEFYGNLDKTATRVINAITKPGDSAELLDAARNELHRIAGGAADSGDVRAAKLTLQQRMEFFNSEPFRNWLQGEKDAGREVFWEKDIDKTQAAGDIFTFFFKWRADNNKFSPENLALIQDFLKSKGMGSGKLEEGPYDILKLWQSKESGGDGISMMEFWSKIYWPTQEGMTRAQKWDQVSAFAPSYAEKVFPGVALENRYLENIGVNVVAVSNGDQELAQAVAPMLGLRPENVVGSNLLYKPNTPDLFPRPDIASGVNHAYDINDKEWWNRPQPGKALAFHYWLHTNRSRFGWDRLNLDHITIAGIDGDSANSDGGMMIFSPKPAAIGNFMIDPPGEPDRIQKFRSLTDKYGWTPGQFLTLKQLPPKSGWKPE